MRRALIVVLAVIGLSTVAPAAPVDAWSWGCSPWLYPVGPCPAGGGGGFGAR